MRIPRCQPAAALLLGWIVPFSLPTQDNQVVPIENWPAPLYWQPVVPEAADSGKSGERHLRQAFSPSAMPASGPLIFVAIPPCRLVDTRGYEPSLTGLYGSPSARRGRECENHPDHRPMRHFLQRPSLLAERHGGFIGIGDSSNHTRAFIAGIRGVTTGTADALPVLIDSAGQLGTISPSRRVKSDIRDMGDTTDTVLHLRPIRFRYTAHGPEGPVQ